MKLFSSVWGVGPETAKNWYAAGYRTLDDVRQHARLTAQQTTGLKYYDDLLLRIPREEVAAIDLLVREQAALLHPQLLTITCGSFRRLKVSPLPFVSFLFSESCKKGIVR